MRKKIFLTALAMLMILCGCGRKTDDNQEINTQNIQEDSQLNTVDEELGEIIAKITSDIGEMPMTENIPLNEEGFKSFTFVDYIEGSVGVANEPMMSSIAHSVVLVKLPKGRDSAAFANEMKINANPRKWLCVEAEKVSVAAKGQLALLVMSSEVVTDKIVDNFKNL